MLLDAAASNSIGKKLSIAKISTREIASIVQPLVPLSSKPLAEIATMSPTSEANNDQSLPSSSSNTTHNHSSKQLDFSETRRSIEELVRLAKSEKFDPNLLSNEEIIELMLPLKVAVYKFESVLGKRNANRCVDIRREYYARELERLDEEQQIRQQQHGTHTHDSEPSAPSSPEEILYHKEKTQSMLDVLRAPKETEFDYTPVVGACCENVIGCVRLPVGLGELLLDGQKVFVPLATTEGCLVASTLRGLSALSKSGGVISQVYKDCMTRAPVVTFVDPDIRVAKSNVKRAVEWLQDPDNKKRMRAAFNSTSQHTRLVDYTITPDGRDIHIRFEAHTGDAMGMNMCSKGAEMALREMQRVFPTMDVVAVSGNMCTDKKPAAINMILGRGKSVECSASLPEEIIEKVLKVPMHKLHQVWDKKMNGSTLAGSIGGFNSHAANIVAAIFLATGQDAAQVVSSSNCMIRMEKDPRGALEVHCKMPSIECGTVGGGTILADQSKYLQLMGIKGPTTSAAHPHGVPADLLGTESNACKLARIICGTVMAAELSLLASLAEGTLVKSHMTLNRSTQPCNVV